MMKWLFYSAFQIMYFVQVVYGIFSDTIHKLLLLYFKTKVFESTSHTDTDSEGLQENE